MNFGISSFGTAGHEQLPLHALPPEFGLEIFYDLGGKDYWNGVLSRVLPGRTGAFSIHAPFEGDTAEMSLAQDEDALFARLREPFALYHRFGAKAYVVHMNAPYGAPPTSAQKAERLKRVEDRLARFNDICAAEGVTLLVENLAFSHGLHTLCNQEDFLGIFARNPALRCIVDTGHAVLGGIDILAVQQALGSRLCAYHIHDNNGLRDGHQRILTGVIDWNRFADGARRYTPDAHFTLEYGPGQATIDEYVQDTHTLRAMIANCL